MSYSPDDHGQSAWQHVSEECSRAHAAVLAGDIGLAQTAVDRVGEELARLMSSTSPVNDALRGHAARAHSELLALAVTQREAIARDLYRIRDGRRALRGYRVTRRGPLGQSHA